MSDPGAGAAAEADAEPFPCSLILRSAARRRLQDEPGTAGRETLPPRGRSGRGRRHRRVRSTKEAPVYRDRNHREPPSHDGGMDTGERTRSDAKTLCWCRLQRIQSTERDPIERTCLTLAPSNLNRPSSHRQGLPWRRRQTTRPWSSEGAAGNTTIHGAHVWMGATLLWSQIYDRELHHVMLLSKHS